MFGILFLWNLLIYTEGVYGDSWSLWWTYEGFSGPKYWGQLNPKWSMCLNGKQQSPINIEPSILLFDPNLKHIKIDSTVVNGILKNTGHDITLSLENDVTGSVNISLGPLPYKYKVAKIQIHFGSADHVGSEHQIAGKSFPAEMQVVAFNVDLYKNLSDAITKVKGVAIVSVLLDFGEETNFAFEEIAKELKRVQYKDKMVKLYQFDVQSILPKTEYYITYEGSTTQPGCYETVTWILLNKPLYISRKQMDSLRVIYPGRENNPDLPLENNARPVMALNQRVVRTNINYRKQSRLCSMEREVYYQGRSPRTVSNSSDYWQEYIHYCRYEVAPIDMFPPVKKLKRQERRMRP